MLKMIRRLDITLAYSWTGVIVSAVVLVATDFIALSMVITEQNVEIAALVLINAVLGFLSLTLFVFSKRGVRRFHRMAGDARALMTAARVTLEGPLSASPDGIIRKGWRGKKRTLKWADIEKVTYDRGEIYLFAKKKLLVAGYATNYAGLSFDLRDVAEAIMKNLPEDKWSKAKEWLDSQIRKNVPEP